MNKSIERPSKEMLQEMIAEMEAVLNDEKTSMSNEERFYLEADLHEARWLLELSEREAAV